MNLLITVRPFVKFKNTDQEVLIGNSTLPDKEIENPDLIMGEWGNHKVLNVCGRMFEQWKRSAVVVIDKENPAWRALRVGSWADGEWEVFNCYGEAIIDQFKFKHHDGQVNTCFSYRWTDGTVTERVNDII